MSEADERELLALADRISRYARPTVPADLRGQLRASLFSAPVVLATAHRPIWARGLALRPVLAGLVVVALLLGGGGYAAAGSLPGDSVFALKRAAEETQVALTFDDAARLDARVTQTDRRIDDLQRVAATRMDSLAVAMDEYLAAVDRLDGELRAVIASPATAERAAAIARASAASADHIALLESLARTLPAAAQPGIQRAIAAQQAIHGRSGYAPGRQPSAPGASEVPGRPTAIPGRPSEIPTPPTRGGPPSTAPGRP